MYKKNKRWNNILNDTDKEIIESSLKTMIFQIAGDYLDFMNNYDDGDAKDILLKYLESSINLVYVAKKNKLFTLSDTIVKMKKGMKRKFIKAMERKDKIVDLCVRLNFTFNLMINEVLQLYFLNILKDTFDEWEHIVDQDSESFDLIDLYSCNSANEFDLEYISKNKIYDVNSNALKSFSN